MGKCVDTVTHRGKMRKVGVASSPPLVIEDETSFVPVKGWTGPRLGRDDKELTQKMSFSEYLKDNH